MDSNYPGSQFGWLSIRLAIATSSLALAIGTNSLADEPATAKFPKRVAEKIASQTKLAAQLWKGQGNVVVGKLEIPPNVDPEQIASRTVLFDDGWFVARLYRGRKLTFLAHGFKPIEIEPPQDAPPLYDAGTIKLEAIGKSDLTTVRGIAVLPKGSDDTRIRIELDIAEPPPIFADWGSEGGSTQPSVSQLYMPAGEEFRFEKLSHFAYRLRLVAPHCIVQTVALPADRPKDFNVSKLTLEKCSTIVINYVSQFSGMPPADTQTRSIECDDQNTFLFTKQRDRYQNKMDLRLHPEAGKIIARFWSFPSGFYDLGKSELKDEIAKFSLERVQNSQKLNWEQPLENGHVYYFECPEKKANCLFSVSIPAQQIDAKSSTQKIPN
jgi:hypothetical protein